MEKFDEKQVKEAKSKILAGYIIAYRLFKLNKELAESCMVELMIRKENGDIFEFEKYIEENVKETQEKYKTNSNLDLTNLNNVNYLLVKKFVPKQN